MSEIIIGRRKVGDAYPCFIIAEAGVNHNGDSELAFRLVDAAVTAGADAVKFQTFHTDQVVSAAAPKAAYQRRTTEPEQSQADMIRALELSPELHRRLRDYCGERGILFLSTPFDPDSADLLERLEVPAFKVGSGEITNLPLLQHIARKHRPMLISTGMSTLAEVQQALETVRATGCEQVALFHCISNYPAEPADANLRAMETMRRAFDVPVGFSDHTLGATVAIAAVALGASLLEKHLTLDRNLPGPDHQSSLEPAEFSSLVQQVRTIELALGSGVKQPTASEAETAAVARRSVVAACDIPQGAVVNNGMLALRRPGTGLSPSSLPQLLGRRARQRIASGTVVKAEMFE